MRTILEILNLSAAYLSQNGIDNARRQAEELLCDALGIDRLHIYLEHDRPLAEVELDKIRAWLKRRAKGEPLPYISGSVQFFGCKFYITPAVLIPRPETEILVDLVSKVLVEQSPLEGKLLWDLCCGSGCIGISLKKAHPSLNVVMSDLSQEALTIAKQNADVNHQQVELLQGDLLAPFEGRKADFLVCNPPYISEAELCLLDREVREHEPRMALLGGQTGLIFYEKLAADLPYVLSAGAKVWLEIGQGQGDAVYDIFKAPYWKNCQLKKDWAGKERFFSLEIE